LAPGPQSLARLTPDPRLPAGSSEFYPSLTDIDASVLVGVVSMSTGNALEDRSQRAVVGAYVVADRAFQTRIARLHLNQD